MSSSRRAGNEESILSMLERDAGRPRLRSVHYAWYGAGGVLAVVLVASLVLLARGNSGAQQVEPIAVAPSGQPEAAPEIERTAAAEAADPRSPMLHEAATIVDEPQAAAPAKQEPDPPPLVLLSAPDSPAAAEAGPAAGQESAPASAREAGDATAARTAASGVAAASGAEQKAPERPARSSHTPNAKKAASKAVAAHDETRRVRKAAHARATSAASAKRVAHATAKKQAKPAQTAEPVDSDVALISAVIQHGTKRANADEAACSGTNCAAKATAQQ